jgi:ATP-dependent helicase/nuclease subunit B
VSGFLGHPAPRWFNIPAHRPFLEDLAAGIWRALEPIGPEALAAAVVLLPTRRAVRALGEAFLTATGRRAVILPQIRALGDLEAGESPFEPGDLTLDLPPAISPIRRRFELAGLAAAHGEALGRRVDAGAALQLADALARFLDACEIEETGDPAAIEALVEGELARHWQVSAAFLEVATRAWPKRLEALGVMDVATRRVVLSRRLAARWRDHPPTDVIIAAGSTGSAPATADLLAAIGAAPRGCVVLPGLDVDLAEAAWSEVGEEHPQGTLRRLLERTGLTRRDVAMWDPLAGVEAAGRWRRRLINEALRPPERTADWLVVIEGLRAEQDPAGEDPIAEGLKGLCVITARTEEEAAGVAALLLRETLETPGETAALITADLALARRVSARLTRWGITAESSAGEPLAGAPIAVLAGLVAGLARDPGDAVRLLAILKHPLTRLGWPGRRRRRAARALERHGLRGPRPEGWEGLEARLGEALAAERRRDQPSQPAIDDLEGALTLAGRLRDALAIARVPFGAGDAAAARAARALAEALEALGEGPEGGPGALWAGDGGEGLGALLSALMAESEALPPVSPDGFADLLDALMAQETVYPDAPGHPRLKILGVLEARLIRADRLILAGLEEGAWPGAAPLDPFLSRPMRARLGLPPPERRTGLAAHDFAQAACAPSAALIQAERSDGAPALASRWLWRLRALVAGANSEVHAVALNARPEITLWARALDAPLTDPPPALRTAARPRPTPPRAARPRRLAVTAVERWVRDPYGLYAREVLRLRPLDAPDAPVEAKARGVAIHRAFERFAADHPGEIGAGAQDAFAALLLEELRAAGMPRARMAREQALATGAAAWAVDFERRRRPGLRRLAVEARGEITFPAPGGPFILHAKADRIEARSGRGDILDIKTGAAPSNKQVSRGLAPQLTLTGAILAGGGFADLGPLTPGELIYLRVSGGRTPGREESRGGGDGAALSRQALDGLKRRVALFDNPATPYIAWARPQFIGLRGEDYDHLARLWEWYVVGEGGEDGE